MQNDEKMALLTQNLGKKGYLEIFVNPQNMITESSNGSIHKYLNRRRVLYPTIDRIVKAGNLVHVVVTPDIYTWRSGKRSFYGAELAECLDKAIETFTPNQQE